MRNKIRIATRESTLAMWQANYVRDRLLEAHPQIQVEIVGMTTQGDRDKSSPLSTIGGKGVFVKELELALLNEDVDIAVHSMKDMPSILPEGLAITAICERADPRDAFVSVHYQSIADIPSSGKIGSSSLRRRLQLKAKYPDLDYVELRGNVGTRLDKLDAGEFDGIILAAAGLARLGWGDRITEYLPTEQCIPSAGQGAVGIESRMSDTWVNDLLSNIDHARTSCCVRCERLITAGLGATCNLPIAAFAELDGDTIHLSTFVSNESGDRVLKMNMSGDIRDGEKMSMELAASLLEKGAAELIKDANP
ncbi:MAG: hydroxymethylbilane synthase [Pseudomonadales bacterium]